ncbi:MAG: pyruvate:ferredoxin (flavodoxin) oxidoreductase [Eubacterium sp.]|nr:pyruvate:ferredoxin (flavodoxin) oxidoreductase [Eubacterium sp.]
MMRVRKTMDGNTAAAHVAYAFSEVSAIYPITPSSPMAESMDEWAAGGRKNLFGEKVKIIEMESEGGAAGAVHGSITAGAYTTTFTASQGLLLMIPNMYKLAGEQTPTVFHVAARALATHALSIFGDHSDVMGCRQTGFAMLCSNSVQQVMDLAAVAHLATIDGKLPMMHFFDGFRTSHEYQKIEVWDYEDLREMVNWDAVRRFREHALNPEHPHLLGSAEQPETFFQHREACNPAYNATVETVAKYMDMVNAKIGTDYKPFNYYGAPDATEILVAMGSVCDAAEEVVDYLNANGHKTGIVEVHLYRPFSVDYLTRVLPETVQKIAVLDRTKEPGGIGEPLFLDICSALRGTKWKDCLIVGGRYGLGSKDVQPGDIQAAFENLWSDAPKQEFTLSINDDVTHLSLPVTSNPDVAPAGTKACKFWGLGADGTVGANKNSVKIIGDHTDKYVQAYFQYDSKKSGGVTISHLRFGDSPIKSTYYVKQADFVACHNSAYLTKYKMVQDVKPGGSFLLNCTWTDEELEQHLPAAVKRYIAQNNVKFYTCNAVEIAKKVGLGARRTNSVLQAAYFQIAQIIDINKAVGYMKDAIVKTYSKKGQNIVDMNCAAVDGGVESVHEVKVPEAWKTVADDPAPAPLAGRDKLHTDYLNNILVPTNTLTGDNCPVSAFLDTADGLLPSGTAMYEKRGIAADLPHWCSGNCMQCNMCAYVCPHGVIRPFVLTAEEAKDYPDAQPMKGMKDMYFVLGFSAKDCTGCGSCAEVCPARKKALEMQAMDTDFMEAAQAKYDKLFATVHNEDRRIPFDNSTVKGSQFAQPLMEFSGACPGCGESPYAKLVTQLFGDRMLCANATGCSMIWGCSAPSTPYTVNKEGRGPAWANSLFEDNAEFGYGMATAVNARRKELQTAVETLRTLAGDSQGAADGMVTATENWLRFMNDGKASRIVGNELLEKCKALVATEAKGVAAAEMKKSAAYIVEHADLLSKPSVWIFGGDGWAYDIGYGGLDHVLASGENVNVLVFDTEVYSNTGGQSSKATPIGAVAKFAAAGKQVKKKDLAQIAMAYGYIYVAQIAMGANPAQTLKALREAEAYDGPSLIIAYAPCINHGVKAGMNRSMLEMRNAVRSGYWNLLRYDPRLAEKGQNPLMLDSSRPTDSYRDFLMGEVRYNSLKLRFPEEAETLFTKGEESAKERYESLHIKAMDSKAKGGDAQ